jgi:5-methylthioadenosine/S-adenosylhomocysteine deaminase
VGALRLSARWVVPITARPIANGAVLVDAAGRLAAVGEEADVPRPEDAASQDLGDVALLPGLVNTHTHLELMALRGLVTGTAFSRWIMTIRRIKDGLPPGSFRAAARWGVLESFAHGISTIGDTGSTGEAARAMADLGARGVAYQEVFGPDSAQLGASLALLEDALRALEPCESKRVAVGVSPHAPYTVSEPLLAAVAARADREQRRIAMHIGESAEERLFVEEGRGPFADHLRSRGIPVAAHGVSPIAWALRGGLEAVQPLLIHCVHGDPHDFAAAARCGASIAHCPWSNQLLGNGRAPLQLMKDAGVNVGVGTDSVAAGNTLDLFAEQRLAATGASLTPNERLRLITAAAADALGIEDAGRLEPGAWGDLCAVSLRGPGFAAAHDIEAALAASAGASDVVATWVAGRLVYQLGEWPGLDAAAERQAFATAAAEARRLKAEG